MEVPAGQEQLYGIVAGEPVADAPRTLHIERHGREAGAGDRAVAAGDRRALRAAGGDLADPRRAPSRARAARSSSPTRSRSSRSAGPAATGCTVDGTRHDAGDKLGYLGANLA